MLSSVCLREVLVRDWKLYSFRLRNPRASVSWVHALVLTNTVASGHKTAGVIGSLLHNRKT